MLASRRRTRCPGIVPAALALSLLVALGACRSEAPATPGTFEGGVLSESEQARLHYATDVRPSSTGMSSRYDPEVVETDEGLVRRIVTYSPVYEIDRIVGAMVGPNSTIGVDLNLGSKKPELLWIKGAYAEMVDEAGETVSPEFMCHLVANVGTVRRHDERLGLVTEDSRFAALAQGFYHKEYPEGFGLPVLSTDDLAYASQVLNYNRRDLPIRVRHKVVTLLIRDSERKVDLEAITPTYAQALVQIGGEHGDGYFGIRVPDEEVHGASCSIGRPADSDVSFTEDGYGRTFTPHWIVDPGEMTLQTNVTRMLKLKYDTTINSIDVHLHPFGRWIELRDVTTQETLFRAEARQRDSGIGLAAVQSYRSPAGIPVYTDHEYALVAHYDNDSSEPQDAMAVMYIGLHDKDFDRALLHDPEARARLRAERERVALRRLETAVRADPEDPQAHYWLGVALFPGERFDEAAEHFRRSASLDPDDPRPRRALARVLDRSRGTAIE